MTNVICEIKGRIVNRDNYSLLSEYTPKDSEVFIVEAEIQIGPKGSEGTDAFWIKVCSPQWLANEVQRNVKPISLHGYLLVRDFSYQAIVDRLSELLVACEGKDWEEASQKLSRYFDWEFS
jgi:hypothetical protein